MPGGLAAARRVRDRERLRLGRRARRSGRRSGGVGSPNAERHGGRPSAPADVGRPRAKNVSGPAGVRAPGAAACSPTASGPGPSPRSRACARSRSGSARSRRRPAGGRARRSRRPARPRGRTAPPRTSGRGAAASRRAPARRPRAPCAPRPGPGRRGPTRDSPDDAGRGGDRRVGEGPVDAADVVHRVPRLRLPQAWRRDQASMPTASSRMMPSVICW